MSDGYQSLGFSDVEEYIALRDYYSEIIKKYMKAKDVADNNRLASLFTIGLGNHEHDDSIAYTRELCADLMALLTNPAISSQLEPHLQPVAGRMLKQLLWIFEEAKELDITLDLNALHHDFPKSFADDLDEKYSRLYEEAGMEMPDIPTGPIALRKAA